MKKFFVLLNWLFFLGFIFTAKATPEEVKRIMNSYLTGGREGLTAIIIPITDRGMVFTIKSKGPDQNFRLFQKKQSPGQEINNFFEESIYGMFNLFRPIDSFNFLIIQNAENNTVSILLFIPNETLKSFRAAIKRQSKDAVVLEIKPLTDRQSITQEAVNIRVVQSFLLNLFGARLVDQATIEYLKLQHQNFIEGTIGSVPAGIVIRYQPIDLRRSGPVTAAQATVPTQALEAEAALEPIRTASPAPAAIDAPIRGAGTAAPAPKIEEAHRPPPLASPDDILVAGRAGLPIAEMQPEVAVAVLVSSAGRAPNPTLVSPEKRAELLQVMQLSAVLGTIDGHRAEYQHTCKKIDDINSENLVLAKKLNELARTACPDRDQQILQIRRKIQDNIIKIRQTLTELETLNLITETYFNELKPDQSESEEVIQKYSDLIKDIESKIEQSNEQIKTLRSSLTPGAKTTRFSLAAGPAPAAILRDPPTAPIGSEGGEQIDRAAIAGWADAVQAPSPAPATTPKASSTGHRSQQVTGSPIAADPGPSVSQAALEVRDAFLVEDKGRQCQYCGDDYDKDPFSTKARASLNCMCPDNFICRVCLFNEKLKDECPTCRCEGLVGTARTAVVRTLKHHGEKGIGVLAELQRKVSSEAVAPVEGISQRGGRGRSVPGRGDLSVSGSSGRGRSASGGPGR